MAQEFVPPIEREYFMGAEAECIAFISKMDAILGYPNAEVKTDTYSKPVKHEKENVYYIPLKSVHGPKLGGKISLDNMDKEMDATQLSKKRTLSTLRTEGAFDKPL